MTAALSHLRRSQIQLLLFFADDTRRTPPPPLRIGNYRALEDRGLLTRRDGRYEISDAGRAVAEHLRVA